MNKWSNGENDNNFFLSNIGNNSKFKGSTNVCKNCFFSSGELERTIYMKWLEGFVKKEIKDYVFLFMKSFYGLKQTLKNLKCNKHLDGYLVLVFKKKWRIMDYIFYDKRVNVCDPRNSRKVENYLLMRYETPFKSWTSMLWFKHANLKKERWS
jgi:hypothetical protein